jgi:hypothetical protein
MHDFPRTALTHSGEVPMADVAAKLAELVTLDPSS